MAYRYEDEVLSELTQIAINERDNGYFKIAREVEEVYRKAKAFDTLLSYNQHVKKYNNSDCHELEQVFQDVIKEYKEDE